MQEPKQPAVELAGRSQLRLRYIIPRQFQRVNLQSFFQDPPRLLVGQAKGVVDRGCIRPKDAIDEPDRKNRIDRLVVVSRLDLAGVEFATVEDEALHQALVSRQLHLDVVNRPRPINRLDVELGEFVLLEILGVEGIIKCDVDDRLFRSEDRVQQADQAGAVLRRPEGLLEGEIDDRADSKRHGKRQ